MKVKLPKGIKSAVDKIIATNRKDDGLGQALVSLVVFSS